MTELTGELYQDAQHYAIHGDEHIKRLMHQLNVANVKNYDAKVLYEQTNRNYAEAESKLADYVIQLNKQEEVK